MSSLYLFILLCTETLTEWCEYVGCRYDAAQNTIKLHTAPFVLRQNINQKLYSLKTPHTSTWTWVCEIEIYGSYVH